MESVDDAQSAYRRYGSALLRKAQRILQDSDDASDVVQALFAELMQRDAPILDLRYLYRAVGHRALNLVRDRKNRARLMGGQDEMLHAPVRAPLDEQVIRMDLLSKLCRHLDTTSQDVLACVYFDDMSQEEAAEFLGLSRKTVGKRVSKIRVAIAALATGGNP